MATMLAMALDGIDPEEKVVRSGGNSPDFTILHHPHLHPHAAIDHTSTAATPPPPFFWSITTTTCTRTPPMISVVFFIATDPVLGEENRKSKLSPAQDFNSDFETIFR